MISRYLNYKNVKEGTDNIIKIGSFFWLAIISPDYSDKEKLRGINVGISIPFTNQEAYNEFRQTLNFEDIFDVFVETYDDDKFTMRQQVFIHDGNAYDEDYGSCCLFGYITTVGMDDRPRLIRPKTELGSLAMALGD